MMLLLTLFFEFFKTGLFAVGGGMATLPFLYDMSARHPDWFTTSQLADMIAVSESTPGPIGVNMATYVGFETGGILGGLIATLGLVAPSIIVILIVARVLKQFRSNPIVEPGGRFYKKLGADRVLVKIRGAYFTAPKWRRRSYRGAVRVTVERVVKKDE